MREIFKPILGFYGVYSASNLGRIRRDKSATNTKKGSILKPYRNKNGYLYVTLCLNGSSYLRTVHRLIVMSFLGEIPHKHQVNHIDGDKENNKLKNLEIVTALQNHRHACENNLHANGERQGLSKLNKIEVLAIRKIHKRGGYTREEIGRMFNVHHSNITYIVQRKTWKHV